jgi:hypothetical protein
MKYWQIMTLLAISLALLMSVLGAPTAVVVLGAAGIVVFGTYLQMKK